MALIPLSDGQTIFVILTNVIALLATVWGGLLVHLDEDRNYEYAIGLMYTWFIIGFAEFFLFAF